MANLKLKNVIPDDLTGKVSEVDQLVRDFARTCSPLEADDSLHILVDARTGARFSESHIHGSKLVSLSTTDVPLDPEEQLEYRANREIVADHSAFLKMKEDARNRRSFSNLVLEFTTEFDPEHPLKVIGGQHRFEAIKEAVDQGIDEIHGVKVYFGLTLEQRLDVQLISNTVIAVSTDLYDRMQETVKGPELREWCQKVGLLPKGEDFADKRQRGMQITVRAARTFIVNYYRGQAVSTKKFDETDSTPVICKSGEEDAEWEKARTRKPAIWKDAKLEEAGREFAQLVEAQRQAFSGPKRKGNLDFEEKALNFAVISAWAFVAGLLASNETRLKRHFAVKGRVGKDPLNAAALAKGRHKTDSDNYRGLGYRTDAKERGRFVELFYLQAEEGSGISPTTIDVAIKKYHAKQAILDVKKAESGHS